MPDDLRRSIHALTAQPIRTAFDEALRISCNRLQVCSVRPQSDVSCHNLAQMLWAEFIDDDFESLDNFAVDDFIDVSKIVEAQATAGISNTPGTHASTTTVIELQHVIRHCHNLTSSSRQRG